MEPDDFLNHESAGTLARLVREDLDPLSIDELGARIALLEREIERCRSRIAFAQAHRASADALFRS